MLFNQLKFRKLSNTNRKLIINVIFIEISRA